MSEEYTTWGVLEGGCTYSWFCAQIISKKTATKEVKLLLYLLQEGSNTKQQDESASNIPKNYRARECRNFVFNGLPSPYSSGYVRLYRPLFN